MNINEFDIDECYGALRIAKLSNAEVLEIVSRMENLTRWISTSERIPTKEDGPTVLAWYSTTYPFPTLVNWYEFPLNSKVVTHWKRIEGPTP